MHDGNGTERNSHGYDDIDFYPDVVVVVVIIVREWVVVVVVMRG